MAVRQTSATAGARTLVRFKPRMDENARSACSRPKPQAPNPKLQKCSNIQAPKPPRWPRVWRTPKAVVCAIPPDRQTTFREFGAGCFFGFWSLGFGAFALGSLATLALLAGGISPALAAETYWLSSLDLQRLEQEWGTPQSDKSVEGHPLSIGGQKFERGLGTHANSTLRVAVGGKAERFTAEVGVDDEVGQRGSVTFKVAGDGKTLWSPSIMRIGRTRRSSWPKAGPRRWPLRVNQRWC